jgi:IS5 family transposase
LVPTLEAASEAVGALPEGASVHLDRGYDSRLSRERLEELGLGWEIWARRRVRLNDEDAGEARVVGLEETREAR